MSIFQEPIKALGDLLGLIAKTNAGTIFTAVGIALIFVSLYTLQKLFKTKPEDTSGWLKFVAIGSLVSGVLFSVGGPSIALLTLKENKIRVVKKEDTFKNLHDNKVISWAIRLIPYSPGAQSDSELTVSNLKTLGPPNVLYTFVASYEELKGYTVKDAVKKSGGLLRPGQRVSAVIFPVDETLVPASARGLLQTLMKIESSQKITVGRKFIEAAGLGQDEKDDLIHHTNLESWSFRNNRSKYTRYCRLSHRFRCDSSFDAKRFLSVIERDWHPAGAAKSTEINPCSDSDNYCAIESWDQMKEQIFDSFGARVFFIENKSLDRLGTRYMIDFQDPEKEVIPEIGERSSSN